MGNKINASSFRMNVTETWKSKWLVKTGFAKKLQEDTTIRAYLMNELKKAGLVRIDIERFADSTVIHIKTTKPGMIIGKGGTGIEDLKKKIFAFLNIDKKAKRDIKLNIEDIKEMNLQSQVIAQDICDQIERRIAFRRAMKQSIERVMEAGAIGVKIECAGRLGGSEIARTERLFKGKLPLHTLRANIDFARATAYTTYGTIGVKVWINKGEVFDTGKAKLKI